MAEKIVYFCDYCHKCKHKSVKDYDEPCDECLHNPTNEDSHKPVNYEEG